MKSSQQFNNEAVLSQIEGRFDAAEIAYLQALDEDPGNGTAHNNLGLLLAQKGQEREALTHFEAALSINPHSDAAHLNKGNLHLANGEMEQAYYHYTKAIELDREHALNWEMYAKFFVLAGQPQEAAEAWAQAAQLNPAETSYHLKLSISLVALGKYNEAKLILMDLVQKESSNPKAWTQLGIVYLLRKDYGIAEELFKKALGLVPEDEQARYHLSLTYIATGENQKAEMELRRIVQLHPHHVKARTDLAILMLSEHKWENALEHLNEALSVDADCVKAKHYHEMALHQMNKTEE
jgi:tetratricopeptide (TPR) repeat protein